MKTLFLGDVAPTWGEPGESFGTAPLFREKKTAELFEDTLSLFQGQDLCFVNLEGPLTESTNAIEKFGPNLKAPAETAEVLKEAGVTVCGLSNNHIFDFGAEGYRDTVAALNRAGLAYTGFGSDEQDARKNYVFSQNGEKLCIIDVCEHEYSYALPDRMGARGFDPFDTIADVRRAAGENDRVIVIYHGGKEHCRYPSPRLRKVCHALAENGADVIIGQHSHCIGCYEKYNNCHILYGQGNFHFVKPGKEAGWSTALAVHYDTKSHEFSVTPIVMKERSIALAKGKEKEGLLALCAGLNASLQDGTWVQGWDAFCQSVRGSYERAICNAYTPGSTERQNKRFGHYLDCEAHHDVWSWLNKTANWTNET